METAVAEPQEDGACCPHPLCQGGAFGHFLFQGNALIEKVLAKSSLLAFTIGLLVEKLLTTSSLLSLTSGLLVKKALVGRHVEAMALV